MCSSVSAFFRMFGGSVRVVTSCRGLCVRIADYSFFVNVAQYMVCFSVDEHLGCFPCGTVLCRL